MPANNNSKRMTPNVSVRIANARDEIWALPGSPRKKPRPLEASQWPGLGPATYPCLSTGLPEAFIGASTCSGTPAGLIQENGPNL